MRQDQFTAGMHYRSEITPGILEMNKMAIEPAAS
jgi:hypothetical protein